MLITLLNAYLVKGYNNIDYYKVPYLRQSSKRLFNYRQSVPILNSNSIKYLVVNIDIESTPWLLDNKYQRGIL